MKIKSEFEQFKEIPRKFTCDGENLNPPLEIIDVPSGTVTLALIVDDPDAPRGTFVHWLIWNIKPNVKWILSGNVPPEIISGINDFGKFKYLGPCPPPSFLHRYYFKLFALDCRMKLEEGSNKEMLEKAMKGHILEKCELVGIYTRR